MMKYIQDRIRERAVKHGILVHTKVLPSRTKLDVSERTMKKLLLRWIGEWLHIRALSSQITASWRMCVDQTPIGGSVDEIEIPRGMICLGPPVELRPVVGEREDEEPVVPEAPELEPGEDAKPAPAAAPRSDDPFAVDVAAAAAAVPRIRRRTTGGIARERDATRRDATHQRAASQRNARNKRAEVRKKADAVVTPMMGAITLICTCHITQTHGNLFATVCFYADSAVSGLRSSSHDMFF